MKALSTVLLVVAAVSVVVCVAAKLQGGILFNIKAISYLVFANTCLLVYLITKK